MGVKASVATIFVGFDNPEVQAGNVVNGKAYLSVVQDDVSCVSIGCRVIGQESTKVTYTVTVGSGENQHTETRMAYERRCFLDMKFCLQQFQSAKIARGQYEFPFNFTMPSNAPATMSHGSAGDHCSVYYTMEVWLDRPGLLRWDIRNTRQIHVVRPMPSNSKVPLYMEPDRIGVFSCCCFHRGDVLLGGAAESSVLYAGATTSIKYAARNYSTVRIKAVEVWLQETLAFHAQGHHEHRARMLFQRRMSPAEAQLNLDKVQGHQGTDFLDTSEGLRQLAELLTSDKTKLTFQIPSHALSTYNGTLIQVRNILCIRLITTFGTANPSITQEIQMYNRAPVQSTPDLGAENASAIPVMPTDWAPSVAPAVVLPALHVQKTATAQQEDDDNKPVTYATAASIKQGAPQGGGLPADGVYTSSAQLAQAVGQTYDPCGELDRFLRQGNRADDIPAEELFTMFKAISDLYDQQRFADTLTAHMTGITCAKVARAAAGARDLCRREVAEKLLSAGPLLDKENAHLIKSELTAFQYMTVERYLR